MKKYFQIGRVVLSYRTYMQFLYAKQAYEIPEMEIGNEREAE
jgi:hypothetical protein